LDARSDRFPIPATVVASEETGTSSSAVHACRVAEVDRDTIGRSSAQVFADRPGRGVPSDQQGRSCYDCDADHDSISFSLWKIVEKEIDRSNATVPGDDKIGCRVSWWFAGSARYPPRASGIT